MNMIQTVRHTGFHGALMAQIRAISWRTHGALMAQIAAVPTGKGPWCDRCAMKGAKPPFMAHKNGQSHLGPKPISWRTHGALMAQKERGPWRASGACHHPAPPS